jgi:hypothetical protein
LHGGLCVCGLKGSEDVQCFVGEGAPDESSQIGCGVGDARPEVLEVQSVGILGDEEGEKDGSGADVQWEGRKVGAHVGYVWAEGGWVELSSCR